MRYLLLILLLALLVSPAAAQDDLPACSALQIEAVVSLVDAHGIIDDYFVLLDELATARTDNEIFSITLDIWAIRQKWFGKLSSKFPDCADLQLFDTYFSLELSNISAQMAIIFVGILGDMDTEEFTDGITDIILADRPIWEAAWNDLFMSVAG